MTDRDQPHDHADLLIGEVRFERDEVYSLRLKLHHTVEADHEREDIPPPLATRGTRDIFLATPYVLIPDIRVKVVPYLIELGDTTVGERTTRSWEGLRHEAIGQVHAWYERDARTLVLRECALVSRYRTGPPLEDGNHRTLWHGVEETLLARLPLANRLATSWAAGYERPAWHRFVTAQGYTKTGPASFAKARPRRGRHCGLGLP